MNSRGYRAWLLTVLLATYTCGFIDRLIVATIGPAIVKDLRLSDLQFGLLGGMAFALFYSAFGVPIARLAERRHRVNIIAISVAVWSAMTALCGLAVSYSQLLIYRMGVGLGEAGCTPPALSLISDHYPASKRGSALAIYSIGVPLGAALGGIGGGWLAETFGWRAAFIVVGAPGLLLAILVRSTLAEPPRGFADGSTPDTDPPPLVAVLGRIWRQRSVFHIVAGCAITTMATNGINLFAPSYFVRRFAMGLGEVGLLYGLILGGATTVGLLAGGFGADLGARRDARWYAWIPAIGVTLAAPFYLLAFSRAAASTALLFVLLGGLSWSFYFAPSVALVQNAVEPRMRASAAALLLLAMNLLGQGIGPTIMGFLSDVFANRAFRLGNYAVSCLGRTVNEGHADACAEASAAGLQAAILAASLLLLWGGLHYALSARSMAREQTSGPA